MHQDEFFDILNRNHTGRYDCKMSIAFLETTATTGSAGTVELLSTLALPVLLLVVFYFFLIRPQNKKEKKANEMRNSIEVGDGITTIGGIVGHVASIKEDTFVLETGADRVKLRFKRWAIQDVEKLNLDADKNDNKAKDSKK